MRNIIYIFYIAEGRAVGIPPPPRCRLTPDHGAPFVQRAELPQLGDLAWVPHCKEPLDPLSLGPRTDIGEPELWPAFLQGEQPPLCEAPVGKSPVVVVAFALQLKSAHAHSDPLVELSQCIGGLGHPDVSRPTSQNRVKIREDGIDVPALLSARQLSDFVLESLDGFGFDSQAVRSKSKPEKLKACPEVRQRRLFRVELQLDCLGICI